MWTCSLCISSNIIYWGATYIIHSNDNEGSNYKYVKSFRHGILICRKVCICDLFQYEKYRGVVSVYKTSLCTVFDTQVTVTVFPPLVCLFYNDPCIRHLHVLDYIDTVYTYGLAEDKLHIVGNDKDHVG